MSDGSFKHGILIKEGLIAGKLNCVAAPKKSGALTLFLLIIILEALLCVSLTLYTTDFSLQQFLFFIFLPQQFFSSE
jgi:hypothetical protein